LGLCGSPLWHFSVGALIIEELSNVKSHRVAKAMPLRYLLLMSLKRVEYNANKI
jgi:hypothetical protein